jgi:hypothetical protein
MSARWRIVQIAFDLRPAIGGLSLIAFGKPDFHITGRGAGKKKRSPTEAVSACKCNVRLGRDFDRAVAVVHHNRRVQIFDLGRRAVFAFDEFLPLGGVKPVGVGARFPDIDAADAATVLAHPIVLAQQASDALIFRRGDLKGPGDLIERGRLGEIECCNSDNHDCSPLEELSVPTKTRSWLAMVCCWVCAVVMAPLRSANAPATTAGFRKDRRTGGLSIYCGAMSAIGTKRTCRVALHMSAFGGKADMASCSADVGF